MAQNSKIARKSVFLLGYVSDFSGYLDICDFGIDRVSRSIFHYAINCVI